MYAVVTAADLNATRVATIVISPGDDPDAAPATINRQGALMYTLTIDDHGHDVSTLHDTPEAAQATLHTYLVLSDYCYRPTQLSGTHTAFELLSLDESPTPSSTPAAQRDRFSASRSWPGCCRNRQLPAELAHFCGLRQLGRAIMTCLLSLVVALLFTGPQCDRSVEQGQPPPPPLLSR